MKKKAGLRISLFMAMVSLLLLISACKNSNTVTNREGNVYKTIDIGDQVWMAENLDVSTFRNGDLIPEAKSAEEWKKFGETGKPAWCYYGNDKANGKIYAKLYNWYAVNDPRGIAPAGWHLPGEAEWRTLIDNLGGENQAGENMKSTTGWENDGNGTNKLGFQGFPGGHCLFDGRFEEIGKSCYWWSTTTTDFNSAFACSIGSLNNMVIIVPEELPRGLSVRCLKDTSAFNSKSISSVTSESETPDPIPQEAGLSNSQISEFKVGDIVDAKYKVFGIGEYEKDDLLAFHVKNIFKIKNYDIIIFVRNIPCTTTICPEELEFFLLKDGKILNRRSESFEREGSPSCEILHETFIQYIELKHDWHENENGVMTYDESKDFKGGIRLVILNSRLYSITELSKSDLRICKNLIFAKYGYVFKSEDLNQYFLETEWYKPNPDIDINAELTETDKELTDYIIKIEASL
jgi:uncharacterized protein (TIGR02145 family)